MCGVHIHEFGMFHEIFIQTVIELKLQLDCALWVQLVIDGLGSGFSNKKALNQLRYV